MATARPPTQPTAHLLVGQTVHYRDGEHCWAAAIVESGPGENAQLYLFPLPPSFPMPPAPGTFVPHDGGKADETWHRLIECADRLRQPARRARRGRASRGPE
jgi:hypothetical protein